MNANYFFHLAYPWTLTITVPLIAVGVLIRYFFHKPLAYRYPLANYLSLQPNISTKFTRSHISFGIRIASLCMMALLVARPQWGDTRSNIDIEGIDIMLAIDISGSMQLFDDINDRRSRIDVAKQEAVNFIKKRPNDPIGIIVFGADTLSVAPPTLDKTMLTEAVNSLKIGFVDENGTALEQGLATAVARLRSSKTKNPIIILLTDGQPTGHSAISIDQALTFAKEYNVKVYTIGIGNEQGGYIQHFGQIFPQRDSGVDKALLARIATETGGSFFMAHNPEEMRQIYEKINQLEKTKQTVELFSTYYEAFWQCMLILLLLLLTEGFLTIFIWKGIAW